MSMRTLALIGCVAAFVQAETVNPYFIGNSLTMQMTPSTMEDLAALRGHSCTIGVTTIPGAPLYYMYDRPEQLSYDEDLPDGSLPWTALSLQAYNAGYDSDREYGGKFMDLALQGNPDIQVYVYAQYPKPSQGDWETAWLESGDVREINYRSRQYFEDLAQVLSDDHPAAKPVLVVPLGHALYEFHLRAQAGLVPGYSHVHEVITDGVHLNDVGCYLERMVFYATLFGEDPAGLPVDDENLDPAMIDLLQDIAWDVVTRVPASGITDPSRSLELTTIFLPTVYAGLSYERQLHAAYGQEPYSWRISGGSLPAGFSLDATTGILSGSSSALGSYPLAIEVTDNQGAISSAALTLLIEADTAPVIQRPTLPLAWQQGQRQQITLQATAGNGEKTWQVIDGHLPLGLALEANGKLSGTPVETGDFAVQVQVTDSYPDPADSDSAWLWFRVATAAGGDVLTPFTMSAPAIDGSIGSDEWSGWQQVTRVVDGNDDAAAPRFALQWNFWGLYAVIEASDAMVQDADAFEFFLDGHHNEESMFNSDDRHLRIGLDGSMDTTGDHVGIQIAVASDGDLHRCEIAIPWGNLGIAALAGRTLGLDVGYSDDDSGDGRERRYLWHGDMSNDDDNRPFGNLVLQGDGGLRRWEEHFDDGLMGGWAVLDNVWTEADGELRCTSQYGPGSVHFQDPLALTWRKYTAAAIMRNADTDGYGNEQMGLRILQPEPLTYLQCKLVDVDQTRALTRALNGVKGISLADESHSPTGGMDFVLSLRLENGNAIAEMDGMELFGGPVPVTDDTSRSGSVGIYSKTTNPFIISSLTVSWPDPGPVPQPASDLSVSADGDDALVSWSVSGEAAQVLRYRAPGGDWHVLAVLPDGEHSYRHVGQAAAGGDYAVLALGSGGSSSAWSSESLTVQAQALSHEQIRVIWDGVDDADGYLINRSKPDVANEMAIRLVGSATTALIDTDLPPETAYVYQVQAYQLD